MSIWWSTERNADQHVHPVEVERETADFIFIKETVRIGFREPKQVVDRTRRVAKFSSHGNYYPTKFEALHSLMTACNARIISLEESLRKENAKLASLDTALNEAKAEAIK